MAPDAHTHTHHASSPIARRCSVTSGPSTGRRETVAWASNADPNAPRAEVIKIEHPTRGDDTRAWGPPYAPYHPTSPHAGAGESAYFLSVHLAVVVPSRPTP